MDKEYVDEDPFALFKRAEEDVSAINALLNHSDVPDEYNYLPICYHATQAVEKFIKGLIVENKVQVKKSHNLDYIQNVAENMDKNFSLIRKECLTLNEYTQGARYNDNHKIESDEIKTVLKSLNVIYNFDPIAKMREQYKKRDGYRTLPEFDFLKKSEEKPAP
jgi:HEPN domain-containing protein